MHLIAKDIYFMIMIIKPISSLPQRAPYTVNLPTLPVSFHSLHLVCTFYCYILKDFFFKVLKKFLKTLLLKM